MDRFFAATGILSRTLRDYEPRIEQLRMSEGIADALKNGGHLIVEAGTGVGKSLAYLIPIVEWVLDRADPEGPGHKRAVVSTYTKALQRQLIEKELPFLKDHIFKTQVFGVLSPAILTSATLATNGNFDYIKERLGLSEARTLLLHSPFDYNTQTLLYIPNGVREPHSEGYEDDLINHIKRILEVTMGRTLVLFTSHSLLTKAYNATEIPGLKLLRQGNMDSYRLVQEFRENKHSVLFGTYTFWQGIDIPGDDLQCVIITKLPFAVPDEPVIEARMEALVREGKNPFYQYQIPQAAILLKQGFGRLIRTRTDRGAVVILDSRVKTRGYGMQFLKSLPECKTTTSLSDVEEFFNIENCKLQI